MNLSAYLLLFSLLCFSASAAEDLPPSGQPAVVTKFLTLFDQLRAADTAKQAGKYRHISFSLSESEINDYSVTLSKQRPARAWTPSTSKYSPDPISPLTRFSISMPSRSGIPEPFRRSSIPCLTAGRPSESTSGSTPTIRRSAFQWKKPGIKARICRRSWFPRSSGSSLPGNRNITIHRSRCRFRSV